jgi:hypothetical protein
MRRAPHGRDRHGDRRQAQGLRLHYSRTGDLDLADQLVAVLEWQRFHILIDRKGIHGAEDWKERLGQLILESDTVVFLLSPDSAESDICAWEVEEAARRRKRIIPALCRPLDGKPRLLPAPRPAALVLHHAQVAL